MTEMNERQNADAVNEEVDPNDAVLEEVRQMLSELKGEHGDSNILESLQVWLQNQDLEEPLQKHYADCRYFGVEPCERWVDRFDIASISTWNDSQIGFNLCALLAVFFETFNKYTNSEERTTLEDMLRDKIKFYMDPRCWGSYWFKEIEPKAVDGLFHIVKMIDAEQGL